MLKGFGDECSNPEIIEMTDDIIEGLLDMHNKQRNSHANGKTPHYEPATRMATMVSIVFFVHLISQKVNDFIILLRFGTTN